MILVIQEFFSGGAHSFLFFFVMNLWEQKEGNMHEYKPSLQSMKSKLLKIKLPKGGFHREPFFLEPFSERFLKEPFFIV